MRVVAIIWLLLWTSAAGAQPASGDPSAMPVRMMTPAQQREDLTRLRFTLERAHPGLHRYIERPVLDAMFASVEAAARTPASNLEFYRRLAPLIGAIRDSHTSLRPAEDLMRFFRSNDRTVFPLDLRYVDGRALVEADLGGQPAIAAGSELLAVDGRPIVEINARLIAPLAVDGYNEPSQLGRLNTNFWLYYGLFYGPSADYRVRVRDATTGRVADRVLAGVSPSRILSRETGPARESQRLEFPGDGIAILTIDQLSDPGTGAFLRQAFRRIAAERVTDLIIDLRKCPGGEDRFNNQLMSFLVDRPFRFYWSRDFVVRSYDDLRHINYTIDDFVPAVQLERMPPDQRRDPLNALTLPQLIRFMHSVDESDGVFAPAREDRFIGRVYWLMGGGSASSAAEIAAIAHHLGVGTIIGEEPNGAYQGLAAGAIPVLELPNSGVRVRVPLVFYHNAVVAGAFPGRAAPPAFPLVQSLADAIAGVDTVMTFTRSLIAARRRGEAPNPTPR